MALCKKSDFALHTFYADASVALSTHELIKKLPAFIGDVAQHCHYYVRPQLTHFSDHHEAINSRSKNRKYMKRAEVMLSTARRGHEQRSTFQSQSHHLSDDHILQTLRVLNPKLITISEAQLVALLQPMVDPRCDAILKRSARTRNAVHFFLLHQDGDCKAFDDAPHSVTEQSWNGERTRKSPSIRSGNALNDVMAV